MKLNKAIKIWGLLAFFHLLNVDLVGQMTDYQSLKERFKIRETDALAKIAIPNITIFQQLPAVPLRAQGNVPKAYNYNELGFFCKVEVQMEKVTKLPIKFRLGDVQYLEKLEGKPYSPFLID